MKKRILVVMAGALMLATSSFVAFASTTENTQEVTIAQEELTFSAVELEKVPQAILDAAAKEYEGLTVSAAQVAKNKDEKAIYKLTLKDAEDKDITALFNEDGTKFLPVSKE